MPKERNRCEGLKLPRPPPPRRRPSRPHPRKQILTLVLILAVKLDVLIPDPISHLPTTLLNTPVRIPESIPPRPLDNPLRLQNVLAHLIPLTHLLSLYILPPQHAAANAAADVADGVCAGDELARDGFVGLRVGEVALLHAVVLCGLERGGRRWGHEVRAAVAAREAFGYYGGGGEEVGEAFCAMEVRGWGPGEEGGWAGWGGGRRGCAGGCGRAAAAAEREAWEEVEGERGGRFVGKDGHGRGGCWWRCWLAVW